MSGTAHHGLGELTPEIERFFEARYWPSGPHPGIETGKLSSVGECRVRNIKWYCFGDASTSLCSHYGIFVELNYDDDHQPEWRIRLKSDCSALVSILERNLSLIEQRVRLGRRSISPPLQNRSFREPVLRSCQRCSVSRNDSGRSLVSQSPKGDCFRMRVGCFRLHGRKTKPRPSCAERPGP